LPQLGVHRVGKLGRLHHLGQRAIAVGGRAAHERLQRVADRRGGGQLRGQRIGPGDGRLVGAAPQQRGGEDQQQGAGDRQTDQGHEEVG
jgi:hypothetical protein